MKTTIALLLLLFASCTSSTINAVTPKPVKWCDEFQESLSLEDAN